MISFTASKGVAASFLAAGFIALAVSSTYGQVIVKPIAVTKGFERQYTVAERNNLYCAGFVQSLPINTSMQIVGGHEEQDQYIYSENNVVYFNIPSARGINVGDMFSVVRPRGDVNTEWTKKDKLGFFVQEVGAVEVIRVKREVAVARIKTSCDNFLLGDLIQPFQVRVSPMYRDRPALDRYAEPSGKAVGRLFMARDNQEMVTRDQIVYVDLGADDRVNVGDYLTVFRPLGKGNLMMPNESQTVQNSSYGYESFEYKGGRKSNQAPRKSGETSGGDPVSQKNAKSGRPEYLRKVVGELVVLNVKERTATAVVVRTANEIHTGDYVEVQ